jgi:hypothetical protein
MDGSGPHGVVQLPGIAWFKIKASKRIIVQNVTDVFQAELSTMKYVGSVMCSIISCQTSNVTMCLSAMMICGNKRCTAAMLQMNVASVQYCLVMALVAF